MSTPKCRLRLLSCRHERCDDLSRWVRRQFPRVAAAASRAAQGHHHSRTALHTLHRPSGARPASCHRDRCQHRRGQLVDVDRCDDWHFDSRIPTNEQTGEAVYAKNDLDRGHLARRRDPV
nr:DNA/RNA non-specific endonuclease [Cryobacterium sp. LW097]